MRCKHNSMLREYYTSDMFRCRGCNKVMTDQEIANNDLPYDPEWWHIVLIIASIIVVGTSIIIGINKAFFKPVTVYGVVLSHTVTSNRIGEATYHTVARFEDGYIRELSGLNDYVKPVGATVMREYYELK